MIETHAFGDFVPRKINYLLVGSFTAKEAHDDQKKAAYVWFYSNGGRNQFWPMLEEIYNVKLQTRTQMQKLFKGLDMAMVDIISSCERKKNSSLDVHLTNITYNIQGITKVIKTYHPKTIYFTSQFTETRFRRVFKDIVDHYPASSLITLPSPSPRYVLMTRAQKLEVYKEHLPKLV